AHDGDHRRPRPGLAIDLLEALQQFFLDRTLADRPGLMAKLLDDQHRRILVDGLVDRSHDPLLHQLLDEHSGLDAHLLRQIADGDGLRDGDLAHHRGSRFLETMLQLLPGIRAPAAAAIAAGLLAIATDGQRSALLASLAAGLAGLALLGFALALELLL